MLGMIFLYIMEKNMQNLQIEIQILTFLKMYPAKN